MATKADDLAYSAVCDDCGNTDLGFGSGDGGFYCNACWDAFDEEEALAAETAQKQADEVARMAEAAKAEAARMKKLADERDAEARNVIEARESEARKLLEAREAEAKQQMKALLDEQAKLREEAVRKAQADAEARVKAQQEEAERLRQEAKAAVEAQQAAEEAHRKVEERAKDVQRKHQEAEKRAEEAAARIAALQSAGAAATELDAAKAKQAELEVELMRAKEDHQKQIDAKEAELKQQAADHELQVRNRVAQVILRRLDSITGASAREGWRRWVNFMRRSDIARLEAKSKESEAAQMELKEVRLKMQTEQASATAKLQQLGREADLARRRAEEAELGGASHAAIRSSMEKIKAAAADELKKLEARYNEDFKSVAERVAALALPKPERQAGAGGDAGKDREHVAELEARLARANAENGRLRKALEAQTSDSTSSDAPPAGWEAYVAALVARAQAAEDAALRTATAMRRQVEALRARLDAETRARQGMAATAEEVLARLRERSHVHVDLAIEKCRNVMLQAQATALTALIDDGADAVLMAPTIASLADRMMLAQASTGKFVIDEHDSLRAKLARAQMQLANAEAANAAATRDAEAAVARADAESAAKASAAESVAQRRIEAYMKDATVANARELVEVRDKNAAVQEALKESLAALAEAETRASQAAARETASRAEAAERMATMATRIEALESAHAGGADNDAWVADTKSSVDALASDVDSLLGVMAAAAAAAPAEPTP